MTTGLLTPELATSGPCVIGATGGSGTRVTARIVRDAGLYIGTNLNPYEDALPFGEFSDRWINSYLVREDPDSHPAGMDDDLGRVVRDHLAEMPSDAVGWGWKEPRSIYLLRFYAQAMPSFRFLHFSGTDATWRSPRISSSSRSTARRCSRAGGRRGAGRSGRSHSGTG